MNNKEKGILYSIFTALAIGLGYIPVRKALEVSNLTTANFVLYFFQAFYFLLIIYFLKNKINPVAKLKNNLKGITLVGLSSALGAFLWLYEIGQVGVINTVFILQFTNVFAVLLGIIVLSERFSFGEFIGGSIAIFGTFIFSWKNSDLGWFMILVLLFNAFVFAVQNLWAKIYVKDTDPITLSAGRAFVMMLPFSLLMLTNNSDFKYSAGLLGYLAIAAILSVLGFIFFYKSFSLIEVSKAQVARTPESFFTMIFSFVLLGAVPTLYQIIGGVIIIFGIIILILSKPKMQKES